MRDYSAHAVDVLSEWSQRRARGFVGGSATMIGQAASSAVLVATLQPPTSGIYYGRFIDSLVGGVVGVLVIDGAAASLAPVRWRAKGPLAQYAEGSVHVDRAIRNGRVLARRAVSMLNDHEAFPDDFAECLETLADAVRELRRELAGGAEPQRTRQYALSAVGQAAEAYRQGLGFSGSVVVAQVRSIATDLLRATGLDEKTAIRAVRRSVGRLAT